MALTDMGGNGLTAADVAAVVGNGNNGWGFGGDGAWWLLVLFLFAMNGGMWGNNGNQGIPFNAINTQNDVQRGFDQQALMSGINGINAAIANGFSTVGMGLQNCCSENRASIADLKYTVATENCADRAAVSSGIRDIIASQTANTQAILDKLCQQEIDAKNETIANLRTQLNMANLAASQVAQTGQILADNAAQTAVLRQSLNPTPIPAYVVQNPSCCNTGYSGCGCGNM